MHRNNSKRKIVIYSLLGVLLLMTVGYASFQSSLKIKGTSKVSSNWDIEITNVTSGTSTGSAENGKDENGNVVLPSWDKLSASINADLYESGDSMTYVVTIENKGTIDAEISDIIPRYSNPNQNYSNNDAIIITFSGFTKGQKLYKAGHSGSTVDITVKVSYNENYNGGAVSGEASIDFNFTQAKTEDIKEGEIDTENKYLVTYNCIENGGTDCTGNNEYYYVGEQVDLSNNIGDVTTNGYTLIGWNTNKEAEEGLENYEMPNEDKVLYAIYSKTLNVTYQKEEGVSSISKEKDTCTMYNLNTKCEITLPTIMAEDKDYYKADGWYKNSEKIGSSKDKINISEDTVLTSKVIAIPIMMSGPNFQTAIDSYKSSITSVEFLDDIDIPDGAISIDVSEKQNKSVMAWLVDDGNNGYKLYIGGKDGVIANEDCSKLFYEFMNVITFDVSNLNTSKATNMSYIFGATNEYEMKVKKIIGLENFDTSKVTDMYGMFRNCVNLYELNLNSFNTSKVIDMTDMFLYCKSINNLKINNFDTSSVKTMQGMFYGIENVSVLDLYNFNTENVTNMYGMFIDSFNLKTIYVSEKFVMTNVTNSVSMFRGCSNIVGGNGTTFDSNYIDKTYAKIDKEGQKGYFTLGSSNGIDLSISTSAKTESITIVSNALSSNAINKYEYSIDNGETWIESIDTHTFNNLKENTEYNVIAKVTDSSGSTKEVSKKVFTPALTSPTYSEADVSGSKRVRIIYPEGCGSVYTCTYSKNGNDYITVTDTSEYVYFTEEGNIIAKVTDGTNEVSSSYNVIFDNLLDYTGSEETFVATESGKYKLEVWGAQGGNATYNSKTYTGGYGAYSTGVIELKKDTVIYLNNGGQGQSSTGGNFVGTGDNKTGYNGGGYGDSYTNNSSGGGGGGATHIALSSGLLSTFEGNQGNLLIVAGAGGGAKTHASNPSYSGDGGDGGGIVGTDGKNATNRCYSIGRGGTQSATGEHLKCNVDGRDYSKISGGFGYGANLPAYNSSETLAGGGGGYYGGADGWHAPAGGGSGYIGNYKLTDKYMACYDCETSSEESTKTISVNCHSDRPIANCAKEGNGYAKITKVSDISTPTFVDISGDIEIQYPEGCNNKYTCTYSKNGGEYVTVTSNPTITFDEDGYIVAKVTDGDEIVSSSYKFIKDKIYVKSDGNDSAGHGTISSPYASLAKAYYQATSTKEATIYVMDDITQTETTTMDKEKDITLTSCTKNGTGCSYSSANSLVRSSSLTLAIIDLNFGKLNLKNILFDGNNISASSSMINARSTLNIDTGTILKNALNSGNGGALWISTDAVVTMKDGEISNNTALNGGGICISNGTINLTGGTISGNNSTSNGGAIYSGSNMNVSINISDGNISNNHGLYGGAIFSYGYGRINLSGGTISNNSSTYSAGAIDSYSDIYMTGGTIKDNTAGTYGGAIMCRKSGSFTGGSITGNTSNTSSSGGGIHIDGNCSIGGSITINDNTAKTSKMNNIGIGGADSHTLNDLNANFSYNGSTQKIVSAVNNNYAIDVKDGSASSGTNVQINTYSNANRMKWKLFPAKTVNGAIYYYVESQISSSYYLYYESQKVFTWSFNTWQGFYWTLANSGSSYYYFKNQNNELCLNLTNSTISNGVDINATTCNNGNTQKWKLIGV